MTSKSSDAAEVLRAVEKALPNIRSYLCNMLRQEKLSLEAEALRARYEAMLVSLEKACQPLDQQRHSVIGLSPHRGSFAEGSHESLERLQTELFGYLLWEDGHQRWHRKYCSLVNHTLVISDSPEDNQGKTVSLNGASISLETESCDKQLCFSLQLSGDDRTEMLFAAYSDEEYHKWQAALEQAIRRVQLGDSLQSRESLSLGDRPLEADEDHYSDGTIYEDIDELVQQFDATINATVQQIQIMSPKKKAKGNFFFSKGTEQKEVETRTRQLELGKHHQGYLHKRSGSSWRKKWCTLKGCVFAYKKSQDSTRSHDYILLKADVALVKDAKRSHVFKLACKGVEDMFFAASSDEELTEWLSLLTDASKRSDDFPTAISENGNMAQSMPEGIYNVPRSSALLYDVPRSIPLGELDYRMSSSNPFDLYDIPRHIASPTDAIYDYPLDLELDDMEIYDYPPDVSIDDSEGRLNRYEGRHDSRRDSGSGSSTPASGDGTSTGSRLSGSLGSFEELVGLGDGFRSLPLTPSSHVESFLSKINQKPEDLSLEANHVVIRGPLYRKERLKWTKYFCLIRNSFLECHRNSTSVLSGGKPALKLFLVGSQVAPLLDSKRSWTFQLKHARREGVLLFATDTEADFKQWMEAFQSSTTIEVQKVNSMEQIRIQDSDLKREWRSLERGLGEDKQDGKRRKSSRKSFIRSHKRSKSGNNLDQSGSSDHQDGGLRPRSVSVHVSTGSSELPQIASSPHRTMSPHGQTCFRGYLRVKADDEKWARLWCVFEDKVVSCYTSQRNMTLVHKVSLWGCTITRVDDELKKNFTFRIWNSETRRPHYFSAVDEEEFLTWFTEITNGAERVTNDTTTVYYYPATPEGASPRIPTRHHPTSGKHTHSPTQAVVTKEGPLKRRSDKGVWNDRYCRLKDKTLYVYYTNVDQTPITVIAVQHCTVTRSEARETESYVLNINVIGGKVHSFSSDSEDGLVDWINTLQGCCKTGKKSPVLTSAKEEGVAASALTNPVHAGYCDVKAKANWVRRWCVVDNDCLYMYQNQESTSPISTVNLRGCEISSAGGKAKKPFSISVGSGLWMAALDQIDMRKWFMALDGASKGIAAASSPPVPANAPVPTNVPIPTSAPISTSVPIPTNVPVPASVPTPPSNVPVPPTNVPIPTNAPTPTDVPIPTSMPVPSTKSTTDPISLESVAIIEPVPIESDATTEPVTAATDESATAVDKVHVNPQDEYLAKKTSILSHFEKKVQKTRRVSQNTEQSLKRQQKQLSSLKGQFMEHIKRMESSQNPSDVKKVQEMKVKLKQVSKILPYLEKYVSVNRQAEVQTLTVLKESCVVKLRELDAKYGRKGSLPGGSVAARMARLEKAQSLPSIKIKRKPLHSEETDTNQDTADRLSPILDQPILAPEILKQDTQVVDLYEEPAYAAITPIKPKQTLADEHYTELHPNKASPTEQYAELEFKHPGTATSPEVPFGVEYSTVQHGDRSLGDSSVLVTPQVTEVVMGFNSPAGQDKCHDDFSDSLASTSNVSVELHLSGIEETLSTCDESLPTNMLASPTHVVDSTPPPSLSPPSLSPPSLSPPTTKSVSFSTHGDSQTESVAKSPLSSPSKSAPPPPVKAKPKRPRSSASPVKVDGRNVEVPYSTSLAERMKAFQQNS